MLDPLAGVAMQVQKGKDELVPPVSKTGERLVFEFPIDVDLQPGSPPNFLGKFAQGPKQERFVYVNSGTYAGQHITCWSRRAKISLMSITAEQVTEAIETAKPLETEFPGVGRDGGPTCASVKGIEWKVAAK